MASSRQAGDDMSSAIELSYVVAPGGALPPESSPASRAGSQVVLSGAVMWGKPVAADTLRRIADALTKSTANGVLDHLFGAPEAHGFE